MRRYVWIRFQSYMFVEQITNVDMPSYVSIYLHFIRRICADKKIGIYLFLDRRCIKMMVRILISLHFNIYRDASFEA